MKALGLTVRWLAALLIVGILLAGSAVAGQKAIFVLFSREWPPFELVVDGKPSGAAVDLFLAVMPPEVEASVEMMPAPRSLLRASGKPVHARLECMDWMPKSVDYLWSDPVVTVQSVLYSPATRPVEFRDNTSLHGLTVGCIGNYTYPEVEPLFASGKAVRYDVNDDILLLRMLAAGRVDVAIFDDVSAAWMIHQTPDINPRDYHIASTPLRSNELRFVFNQDSDWEAMLPRVNEMIRQKREDGTLDAIMARYR